MVPSEPTITVPGSGTLCSSAAAACWAGHCRLKLTQAQTQDGRWKGRHESSDVTAGCESPLIITARACLVLLRPTGAAP
jgi:hypothetical protein